MPGFGINFAQYDKDAKYRAFVDSTVKPYGVDVGLYRRDDRYRTFADSQYDAVSRPPSPAPVRASAPPVEEGRGAIEEFGRGVAKGLSGAGTSLIKGAGYLGELAGAEDNVLQRFARETEQEAQAFYDPRGTAGKVGQFAGQALGGIATGAGTARLAGRAIAGIAPRAAAALQGAAPVGQRVAAQAAINAPVDVLQGLSEERGGMVLPGRAGAVAENVLFSAAGGLLPGGRAAKAAQPTATKEGLEATGRRLETQVERIAREGDVPANVTPEDYINVARFSDDPAVQRRLLAATQRAVEETDIPARLPARPGEKLGRLAEPETFLDVRDRIAKEGGISPADVIVRTKNGERIGRDDLLRVRTALNQVLAEENELYKRIADQAFETAEEARTAGVVLERLRNESNGLLNVISKQGTMTAQDLSAMRMGALQSSDPGVWIGRMQALAKRTLSDAERAAIYKAAEAKDLDTLMRLGRDVQKSTFGEKVAAIFRANLLTNPKTHAINITGNVGMRLLETAKDVPATLFDALVGAATGVRTKDLSLKDLALGGMQGAKKGLADAAEVLRRGDVDTRAFDIPRQVNFDSPIANAYVHGVFRALSAEDKFFRTMAYTRSLEEQARIMAKAKGLKGQALIDDVQATVRKPSAAMEAQAIMDADVATFRQDSGLAQAASQFRSGLGKVVSEPIANLIMPFARTPANIAQTILNYSPVGAISAAGKLRGVGKGAAGVARQKEAVEALGRASLGTAAMWAGYQMAKKDEMTGFYPFDEKTRKEWELTGRTEGSVKIGDQWVQVNRLSPLGNLLTIGAALHQLEQEDPDVAALVIGTATAPASAVYDLPMVSGVRDLIEVFRPSAAGQRGERATKYVGRLAQGFIPAAGLVRGVARGMDETVRQTRTGEGTSVGRMLQSGIPGAAEQLPERLTALGEPLQRQGGLLQSLLSPVQTSRVKTATDPLLREIERTKAVPTPLQQRKGESDAMFAERQRTTGGVIRQVLSDVTQNQQYRDIQRMDPMEIRQILASKRIDTSKMDDAQVRTRFQRYVLDDVISRVKGDVGKSFPAPFPEVIVP